MKRLLLLCTMVILVQLTNAQTYGDPTFNPTDVGWNSFSGPNYINSGILQTGSVFSQAKLPDGKILIGGIISSYNGQGYLNTSNVDCNFLRINVDGSRDTTFNQNGVGANGSVQAITLQPDGKILIGGFFSKYNDITVNRICRLNSDGSFDPTFNSAIGVPSGGYVYKILLLPSGKMIVGGDFNKFNLINVKNIVQLNSDGSVDETFNSGGSGFTYGSGNYNIKELALMTDGKILAGGYFNDYNGTTAKGFVRLNANGSLDNTFSAITNTFPSTAFVTSFFIRPDGKIWVTGRDLSTNGGTNKTGIMLLNSNITIDPSFAVTSGVGSSYIIYSVQPVANNKLLIGGNFLLFNGTEAFKIARINNDGSLDPSFALSNNVYIASTTSVRNIQMQADSSIVFSGTFTNTQNGSNNNGLEKLTKNHVLDLRFNEPTGAKARVKTFTVQPDYKIMIGGKFLAFNKKNRNRIARITFDGELDTTYAPFSGANNDVNSILVQTNGRVLVAGAFSTFNDTLTGRIIRTDAIGNIDTAFLTKIGTGANNIINVLALQGDGKILVGGDFGYFNGITANYLARLNADGSFDNTFNIGSGGFGSIRDIVIQPDGKILIGGNFQFFNTSSSRGIVRLNSDGTVDASFLSGTGFRGLPVNDIELAPNGSIFVSLNNASDGPNGYNGSTYTKPMTKLKPNGTIDSTFFIVGTLDNIYSSNVLPSGDLLVVRSSTSSGDNSTSNVFKLNPAGLTAPFQSSGFNAAGVDKIQAFENGRKILACGNFTSFTTTVNKIGRNRIGRLIDATVAALPLTLQTFTANLNYNDALLKWSTTNEINTDKFILERSTNNSNFQAIGTVLSKGGSENQYQITDYGVSTLNSNILYYRLKMQDKDGKTSYSPIVIVRLISKTSISFSPNPTKGMATLQLQTSVATEQLQINLYDLSGKLVMQQRNSISIGSTSLYLNLTQLQNGMYYLKVSSNLRNETLKVVKQ